MVALFTALALGNIISVLVDVAGTVMGWGPVSSSLGVVPPPFGLDLSPVNTLAILNYVFLPFLLTMAVRLFNRRHFVGLFFDLLGGRPLTNADPQEWVAEYTEFLWGRLLALKFPWMGPSSVQGMTIGEFFHRGGVYRANAIAFLGEQRREERKEDSAHAGRILGGTPFGGKGRRAKLFGIGHRGSSPSVYKDGYISVTTTDDNPAGDDKDLQRLQEIIQDAPARLLVFMKIADEATKILADIAPFQFRRGRTGSGANVANTQTKRPIPIETVHRIFGKSEPVVVAKKPEVVQSSSKVKTLTVVPRTVQPSTSAEMKPSSPATPTQVALPANTVTPVDTAPDLGNGEKLLIRRSPFVRRAVGVVKMLIVVTLTLPLLFSSPSEAIKKEFRETNGIEISLNDRALTQKARPASEKPSTVVLASKDGRLVNLRSEANPKATLLTSIPSETRVIVTGEEVKGFIPVQVGQKVRGYVSASVTRNEPKQEPSSIKDITLNKALVRQFPQPRATLVEKSFTGAAQELARWTDTTNKRDWVLVDIEGRLGYVSADQVVARTPLSGRAGLVEAIAGNDTTPTDEFDASVASATTTAIGASVLPILIGFMRGRKPVEETVQEIRQALEREGTRVNDEDEEALRVFVSSSRDEAPTAKMGLPVVNCLGGFTKEQGSFRDGVEQMLRTRKGSERAIFLVKSPQQMGAIKKRLVSRGISLTGIKFIALERLVKKNYAQLPNKDLGTGASIVLDETLKFMLSPQEMKNVRNVNIFSPLDDETQWISPTGNRYVVMIVRLLAGGAVVSSLEQEGAIRRTLHLLRAA